ncbi:unnamed protein product [Angiostrongylus costaricensis]|uniref:CBFD_NFYB_HMF domain-containing protein n=1 Tax=Angiostrongylus costaricensis TaxID=334426 RepID=A0A0R3PVC1_ANGCS|nr:unnamed protein product [Angiostrongylus costaricensis]
MREHCKHMELPMARVKKVMRLDDEVRSQMISSDAPLLLAAASEMFIQELTLRAWQLVEEGRRKTLQKSDIAAAASRFEHFDFLIDIVPREDIKKVHDEMMNSSLSATSEGSLGTAAHVQYVLAGDGASNNDVYHLDNGQVLHATPIGQPIPIGSPSAGNIDIKEREKIKRKALVGRCDHDIVASFSHHRVIQPGQLCFQEHQPVNGRQDEKVFTVRSDVCENVIEIGREASGSDEGYDYAVAVVNRETGEVTFRPVRLCVFEATHSSDIPQLIGTKKRAPVDYSASYDIKTEDWIKKRMDLTVDFGSSKKMKIQEASVRRQINNETLDAMRKTAFASTSVLAESEDIKLEQISMVDKAQSSILPQAQPAALPRDIYPISTFLNDEEMRDLSDCALFSNRAVAKRQLDEVPFPEPFVQKVMRDYITTQFDRGASGRTATRLSLSSHEKDKLTAHLLALALTLSPDCSLAITQWQIALKKSSRFIEKMLTGLGCDIVQCNVDEAAKTESLRAARLLRPPNKEFSGSRKVRRRR